MQYCEDTISTKPVTICRIEANKTCYQEKKKKYKMIEIANFIFNHLCG